DVGGHRRRRLVDDAGAGAAAPLDQALAREFTQRAPHRDSRDAVRIRKLMLGRQPHTESGGAAQDAVAQHEVDLLRLRLAEPVAQGCLPQIGAVAGFFTWYLLAYIIEDPRQVHRPGGE